MPLGRAIENNFAVPRLDDMGKHLGVCILALLKPTLLYMPRVHPLHAHSLLL